MEMMMPGAGGMMGAAKGAQGGMGGGKNYNQFFKGEKENYELLNYKFKLDDVEDAFLYKYAGKVM